ncbi:hypothetical protein MYX82_00980 [Acidobacteria bacterium AH-259-D05]|nr:hypothetical protein [Acidobacteria bacterium AH-259-D05]
MMDKCCCHPPVGEHEKVVVMLSPGDVVNWIMTIQDRTIHQLGDDISGNYPSL